MKQLALIFLSLLGFASLSAQAFETDFELAQANSIKANKPIVLIFSGSDWCKPCILLKQKILSTSEFELFSKENLVVVNLDFPYRKKNILSKEQQAHNDALAEVYNPKGMFPLVLLLNQDLTVAQQFEYNPKMEPADLISQIETQIPNKDHDHH